MQEEVKWNDRMNIGVESIDKAHKRLFSIMRKLQISMSGDEDGRKRVCIEGIKYFKSYALKHFAEEEEYMQSIDYDGYEISQAAARESEEYHASRTGERFGAV